MLNIESVIDYSKSTLIEIQDNYTVQAGVKLFIKREDLLHPVISGNKWRKLKHNLIRANRENKTTLLSFGGAYSNHLHALALAAKLSGFQSIGIIRGEELTTLNPTLQFLEECGMKLHFISRENYRQKSNPEYLQKLQNDFPDAYIIPEGGCNVEGVKGCIEILEGVIDFDTVCVACGTGTTLAGIAASLNSQKKAIGLSALKGYTQLENEVSRLIKEVKPQNENVNFVINHDYHFGGFAKYPSKLKAFVKEFEKNHSILLDPVYTSKMMYGIYDMIRNGKFRKGERILAIHTGGIQGRQD